MAKTDEVVFFEYVVAQEQIQVDAIEMMIEGNTDQGTQLLLDFIKENSAEQN